MKHQILSAFFFFFLALDWSDIVNKFYAIYAGICVAFFVSFSKDHIQYSSHSCPESYKKVLNKLIILGQSCLNKECTPRLDWLFWVCTVSFHKQDHVTHDKGNGFV